MNNADIPVFITYRDRYSFLLQTLSSLHKRGFYDVTVIDNDSQSYPDLHEISSAKIIRSDNAHRQLAPWLLDLVPDDRYYIVMDCDIELDCPQDVGEVLIDILERHPEIPKVGLGIRTDDLLFPPPEHYSYSYLMEYSVESRFNTIEDRGTCSLIDAPIDTHFAMHRPGSGWPGIVGARTTAPYLCRHLPWYNAEHSEEERLYYRRAGEAWTMGHSAGNLLELDVIVPFVELRSETVVALHGEKVHFSPLLSDSGYYQRLAEQWESGKGFVNIEQDIVVNETTVDELKTCSHDWCAIPFPYRGEDYAYSLACTKFSSALLERHPNLMQHVGGMADALHPAQHWCRLDAWIYAMLTGLGERRHEHSWAKPVGHIGPRFPKHGCLIEGNADA